MTAMVASQRGKTWWEVGAAILSILVTIRSAVACSCICMDLGDTAADRAAYVRADDWTHLVFVGRIVNVTSHTINETGDFEGAEPYPREFQNVSWSLEETLFNSAEDGSLPRNVLVGGDGSMTVETSTETTCCICGMSVWGSVGAEYLISLSKYGPESLSKCDISCPTNNTYSTWCADTEAALRNAGLAEESAAATPAPSVAAVDGSATNVTNNTQEEDAANHNSTNVTNNADSANATDPSTSSDAEMPNTSEIVSKTCYADGVEVPCDQASQPVQEGGAVKEDGAATSGGASASTFVSFFVISVTVAGTIW